MISQPLTQLIRIRQRNRVAAADVAISRAVQVHTLYYGVLVTQLQKKAAEQQTEYATENLRESEEDVRNGSALKVTAIGSRAEMLEGPQSVLTANLQIADLKTELNDLLGLPLDTRSHTRTVLSQLPETITARPCRSPTATDVTRFWWPSSVQCGDLAEPRKALVRQLRAMRSSASALTAAASRSR